MAKNIVVCCDSLYDLVEQGNVVRLYGVLDLSDSQRQVGYYQRGKLERAFSSVNRISSVFDVAFGTGFPSEFVAAYTFLMDAYENGDRVFLFGFGRGAHLVRALASALGQVGLLQRGNTQLVPYMVRALRTRGESGRVFDVLRGSSPRECKPYFVGVWETSALVGWFSTAAIPSLMTPNPHISIGRHALAIDERRSLFRPWRWSPPLPGQDIKEVWFAGNLDDVGGGYPEEESGLSKISLDWMIREAQLAGLIFNAGAVHKLLGNETEGEQPDPRARVHESLVGLWTLFEMLPVRYYDETADPPKARLEIPLGRRRRIPDDALVHESALKRLALDPAYRPRNLPNEPRVEQWHRWQPPVAAPVAGPASRPSPLSFDFPDPLTSAIRSGECVLFAGAGVSATAGLPVWKDFAEAFVRAAQEEGVIAHEDVEFHERALRDRKFDSVVDEMVGRVRPEFVQGFLRATFLRTTDVPAVYRDLSSLRFAAVLTTNFDSLAARAFDYSPQNVRTPADAESINGALSRSEPFLLHLYGTLDRPDTLSVSPAQFDQVISGNLQFRESVQSLSLSRTILFVGCSLEGIETFLKSVGLHGSWTRRHYAIAGVLGTSWEATGGLLDRRYGVQVIPYRDGDADDLRAAVRALQAAVNQD
ncbi:MAG: phospholipase effector Tle1 domain-containing protein, partial [Vicinamibacterales bacterium]